MREENIKRAEQEVCRFMDRLNEYQANPPDHRYSTSPERAALRRASMDLTKALSKMRNEQ